MKIDGESIKEIVYGNFLILILNSDCLSNIKDPEFMEYTLEDLDIVDFDRITVNYIENIYEVVVFWKPTVKNCKFTENIGLSMRYKLFNDDLLKEFNNKIKYTFLIYEDSHILKDESKKKLI